MEHFDVLIVGAGLSGIDAAYHLQKLCPRKTYVILEQRQQIGRALGTCSDYPGIRSDSDMLTMGYSFRPWTNPTTISPGEAIRDYIFADTARDAGIDNHIRFGQKIQSAILVHWRREMDCVAYRAPQATSSQLTCKFSCSPAPVIIATPPATRLNFQTSTGFQGKVVHPQAWPGESRLQLRQASRRHRQRSHRRHAAPLHGEDRRSHVTRCSQAPPSLRPSRSPGKGCQSPISCAASFPSMWAYKLSRWKNVGLHGTYDLPGFPALSEFHEARASVKKVTEAPGPRLRRPDALHSPLITPWEPRMCLVPDADMFEAIKSRSGERRHRSDRDLCWPTGIRLESGKKPSKPISSSPQPASSCSPSEAWNYQSMAAASI